MAGNTKDDIARHAVAPSSPTQTNQERLDLATKRVIAAHGKGTSSELEIGQVLTDVKNQGYFKPSYASMRQYLQSEFGKYDYNKLARLQRIAANDLLAAWYLRLGYSKASMLLMAKILVTAELCEKANVMKVAELRDFVKPAQDESIAGLTVQRERLVKQIESVKIKIAELTARIADLRKAAP